MAGATVVSFCNAAFLANAKRLREIGCRLVWVNCMTWLFDAERKFYRESGPFDAFVFQSEFQRSMLEPELTTLGYSAEHGHLIRGAFDFEEWEFSPRPRADGEAFVVGRAARPDLDKWSSNTWPIYNRIQYRNKRALMLGMFYWGTTRFHREIFSAAWDEHHESVQRYFRSRDDLLVIDIAATSAHQLWKSLSQFVGRPIPDAPFPHLNRSTK